MQIKADSWHKSITFNVFNEIFVIFQTISKKSEIESQEGLPPCPCYQDKLLRVLLFLEISEISIKSKIEWKEDSRCVSRGRCENCKLCILSAIDDFRFALGSDSVVNSRSEGPRETKKATLTYFRVPLDIKQQYLKSK